MDVYTAIHQRRSHRSYRPELPPRKILERVIEAAMWAPSGANLQGWEITVMAGQVRDDFVALISQARQIPHAPVEAGQLPRRGPETGDEVFQEPGGRPGGGGGDHLQGRGRIRQSGP